MALWRVAAVTAVGIGCTGIGVYLAQPSRSAPPRPLKATVMQTPALPDLSPARLKQISGRYVGTPYRLDPLGEGPGRGPDTDPLFTRTAVDCQTLIEQVMAEATAITPQDLDAQVLKIRYGGAEPRLDRRLHFCIPDWFQHPWPVRDVTAQVAPGKTVNITRTIDRARLFKERGLTDVADAPPAEKVTTAYIPRASVAAVEASIPDGSIALFVISNPETTIIGHCGFLFRTADGVILRHASQTRRRVIDEPLSTYLQRAPRRTIGLKVLKPDANALVATR